MRHKNFLKVLILKKKIIGKINGIENSEDAQSIVGKLIYIRREQLPKLKKDQFYFSDLKNLDVFVKEKKIGEVVDVCNHGAGDYLMVHTQKSELLIPIIDSHIIEINLENRIIKLSSNYYEF